MENNTEKNNEGKPTGIAYEPFGNIKSRADRAPKTDNGIKLESGSITPDQVYLVMMGDWPEFPNGCPVLAERMGRNGLLISDIGIIDKAAFERAEYPFDELEQYVVCTKDQFVEVERIREEPQPSRPGELKDIPIDLFNWARKRESKWIFWVLLLSVVALLGRIAS